MNNQRVSNDRDLEVTASKWRYFMEGWYFLKEKPSILTAVLTMNLYSIPPLLQNNFGDKWCSKYSVKCALKCYNETLQTGAQEWWRCREILQFKDSYTALQSQYLSPICREMWQKKRKYNILPALYRTTSVSRLLQLRTGGFCWCKVLLPVCPCWQQSAHSDMG